MLENVAKRILFIVLMLYPLLWVVFDEFSLDVPNLGVWVYEGKAVVHSEMNLALVL